MFDEHADQVIHMISEGLSDARIAAALPGDFTGQQVYRWRLKNQIARPRARSASVLDPYAEDIRRMYVDEGLPDQVIAERLPVEVHINTVRTYRVERLGIESTRFKKVGRFSVEARYEEVRPRLPELWEKSKRWHSKQNRMVGSAERVAKELGISMSKAQEWLARDGLVETRIDGKAASMQAKELFDQGWSVPRIAAHLGASDYSVRGWLNAQGCDLRNHVARMNHEEKLAWRGSISDAKAQGEDTTRCHPYGEHMLGSKYEVIAATQFDRVGLPWRPYSRLDDGVLDYEKVDGHVSRYAPDLVVTFNGADVNIEIKGLYAALDQLKVRSWRKEKGRLSLMLRSDILELEHAATAQEAFDSVRACIYNDPEPKTVEWRV
jgi:transposase